MSVTQWVSGTPTADAYGDEVDAFTSRRVTPLAEYPGNALETDNATRDQVIADAVLLVRPTVTVKATDEFTLSDGDRYKVLGKPGRYVSPFTGTAVTQVNLRRIT